MSQIVPRCSPILLQQKVIQSLVGRSQVWNSIPARTFLRYLLKSTHPLVICLHNISSCVRWIGWLKICFTCERFNMSSLNKISTRVAATNLKKVTQRSVLFSFSENFFQLERLVAGRPLSWAAGHNSCKKESRWWRPTTSTPASTFVSATRRHRHWRQRRRHDQL